MTPKTFWSIVLLSLIFPAQEFWQVWRNDNRDVNWWIALDYPLSIQWYFKDLGNQIAMVLYSFVIYRITYKIQTLRNAAIVVLIYSLTDLAMFFICYNRASAALIYSTVGFVSLIVASIKIIKQIFHKNKFQHQ